MLSLLLGVFRSLFVRLLLTVAILAAGYLFIAKPLIDDASDSVGSASGLIESVSDVLGEDGLGSVLESGDAGAILDRVRSALDSGDADRGDIRRLRACLRRADTRAAARRCARRLGG